jgi:hypothetical protein
MSNSSPFLPSILRLYKDGDVLGMRAHLLHSTAWLQHGRTRFGDEQITGNWMLWLANVGLGECGEAVSLDNGRESLQLLTLKPASGASNIRIALWNWHNKEFIKRLVCIPDTELMAVSMGINTDALVAELPDPDPLHISDYDQQEHPFSVNVCPSDLAELAPNTKNAIEAWWSLWQYQQLAAVNDCYSKDALIQLPGKQTSQSQADLVAYAGHWFQNMRRRYCQPESILADPENPDRIAVLWHMEGDMAVRGTEKTALRRRVRLTAINFLELDRGHIVRDTMVVDQASLHKRLSA